MSERRSSRRISARLSEKENDAPEANGIEASRKAASGAANSTGKAGNADANGGKGAMKGKRKQGDYDEDDNGFKFTRTRAKKAKIQIPEPVLEETQQQEATSKPGPPKKTRRKRSDAPVPAPVMEDAAPVEKPKRRSTRISADQLLKEPEPEPAPIQVKKRRLKEASKEQGKEGERPKTPGQVDEIEVFVDTQLQDAGTKPLSRETMKIALPFADTPIIRRNREMRQDGSRRSSLGNRGRRASSLIETGKSNAIPHEEVESGDFFKHIESGLPEPRRMKQLLTWCGARAIGEKPNTSDEESIIQMAAREIQQQILKDFNIKSEMSDWFSRDDTQAHPQPPQPNPKNLANEQRIRELEQQLARLKAEREAWESLLKAPGNAPLLAPLLSKLPDIRTLNISLLPQSNQSLVVEALSQQPPLVETTMIRLQSIAASLEFDTDMLADSVHTTAQYKKAADRLATKVLDDAARALEERSRKERQKAGAKDVPTRDVLRALSRAGSR